MHLAIDFRHEALPEGVALVEEAPCENGEADPQLEGRLQDVGLAEEPGALEVVKDLLTLLLVLLRVHDVDVPRRDHVLHQQLVELLQPLTCPQVPDPINYEKRI